MKIETSFLCLQLDFKHIEDYFFSNLYFTTTRKKKLSYIDEGKNNFLNSGKTFRTFLLKFISHSILHFEIDVINILVFLFKYFSFFL